VVHLHIRFHDALYRLINFQPLATNCIVKIRLISFQGHGKLIDCGNAMQNDTEIGRVNEPYWYEIATYNTEYFTFDLMRGLWLAHASFDNDQA